MPKDSITVRFHSVGGWGAITTGKNLAMTLFDLLGYHIKANPKYGSEKKGQPTTYYLSAAPEPIKVNCEYFYVDVVLSPDPNVFGHTNALAGLKQGGVFIIQSDAESPEGVGERFRSDSSRSSWTTRDPRVLPRCVQDRARRGHRSGSAAAHAGRRLPGCVLRGLAGNEEGGADDEQLLQAIRDQIEDKFGAKGARVVEDNIRVVKRGFDEVTEIVPSAISSMTAPVSQHSPGAAAADDGQAPAPEQGAGHRHPSFLGADGQLLCPRHGQRQPGGSLHRPGRHAGGPRSLFRDMTGIRFEHPSGSRRTARPAATATRCAPTRLCPGLVNEVGQVLDTLVNA
jgi:pyruvate-ferredoxin/flavodoxin oxidoreductase